MTEIKGLQTGFAEIDGASLYYEIAGDGPNLVLVHAGFVDRRMWDDQFPIFARYYRVLRYDLRGFGSSRFTSTAFSHRRDLYQLLKLLRIERAHLVGCSFGGGVVIDFALEHPEMAASLVPVSSALGGYQFQGEMPKPLQELMAALNEKDINRAAELAVRIWIDGPRRAPDEVDAHIRQLGREMSITALPNIFMTEEPLKPPAIERLDALALPTLVITGEMDDPSVAAIGELLATRIAGARKAVIASAAHLPSMEKPAEFNQMVLEFLKVL